LLPLLVLIQLSTGSSERQIDNLHSEHFQTGLKLHPDKIVAIELGKKFPARPEYIIVHDHSWTEIAWQIARCNGGNLEEHDNINLKFI
jgi:hypothetical protein